MSWYHHAESTAVGADPTSTASKHAALSSAGLTNPARVLHSGPGGRHAARQSRTGHGWLIAAGSAVAGIAGLSLWTGPAAIAGPWDVFSLLNGGYRIYAGQSSSIDFSNPVGPLVYGLTAVGMHLQKTPSLMSVTYGEVIFMALMSALAAAATWRRLPPFYTAAFVVFVAFLSISVRPLGYSPSVTTYAMLYNRYGWLLYATLLLLVLLKRRMAPTRQSVVSDGLVLGFMLGLIFFDKITFFLAALVAVGLGLAFSTLPRRPLFGAAALAGFSVAGILMRAIFNVHVTAYLGDLLKAAEVQSSSNRVGLLAHAIFWVAPVAVISALLLGALFISRSRGGPARDIIVLSVAVAYILGSSILISAGDASEKGNLPALVVIPLLFVVFLEPALPRWIGGSSRNRDRVRPLSRPGLLLIGLALLLVGTSGPIVAEDSLGIGHAIALRSYVADPPASQRFDAPLLKDFVIPADAQWPTGYRTAHNLPAMIDNGLTLLHRYIHPGDTLFTLAFTDPFSAALGLPLSHCGPLWWDLGYDFDQAHYPTAECAIGNDDWVIIPRMIPGQGCCQQTVSVMLNLYSGYLSEHYKQVKQTSDWILLRRTR